MEYKEYFKSDDTRLEFVSFIDVLGFSKAVTDNFNKALEKYNEFINHIDLFGEVINGDLKISVLSDSIILTSSNLNELLTGTNILLHATLAANFLTRGGIATGNHIDIIQNDNFYMVSEALVKAVKLEKNVKHPCIVLHEELHPTDFDPFRLPKNKFTRKLLYFDNLWIVNPFNIMWGTSAADRVKVLKNQYPEHNDKYNWFLNLFDAVWNNEPLVPNI